MGSWEILAQVIDHKVAAEMEMQEPTAFEMTVADALAVLASAFTPFGTDIGRPPNWSEFRLYGVPIRVVVP